MIFGNAMGMQDLKSKTAGKGGLFLQLCCDLKDKE